VMHALIDGREPEITGADGRRTVEVVTGIYEAAIEHKPVDLPLPSDSPWYSGEALLEKAPRYHKKLRSVSGLEGTITTGGSPSA
jgi:hypothetical protein